MKKIKISTELIVGFLASIIAMCSLFVTFWQAMQIQEHNKLSVKPMLRFDLHKNIVVNDSVKSIKYKLTVSNRGIGPAIIKRYAIFLDEKSYESYNDPWKSLLDATKENYTSLNYTFFDPEDVLQAGSEVHLITLPELKSLSKIKVLIEYESMYMEQFSVERKFKPN